MNETGHKPNTIWGDKSSEFYNKSIKSWLEHNNAKAYLTHNEWKFVLA